jgi:hypothetical protein
MMHFPKLADDETLYSLIGRIAYLNGVDDHLRLLRTLMVDPSINSFLGLSRGLEYFSVGTRGLYGNSDEICHKSTSYNLMNHLNCYVSASTGGPKALWLRGGCVEGSNHESREMRCCESCFSADIESMGFTYWRREHQLHTSQVCLTHLEALKVIRLPARRLNDHAWRVEELFEEVNLMGLSWDFDKSISIAMLGRSILKDDSPPYDFRTIQSVIIEELRINGYITKTGKLRNDLMLVLHEDLKLNTRAKFDREIRTLINSSHPFSLTPWFLLLLIERFFGNWKFFKAKCEWMTTIGRFDLDVLQDVDNSIRDRHRKVCLDYINTRTQADRNSFLINHYKSFRWLLHEDKRWLDLNLPISDRQTQLSLFS